MTIVLEIMDLEDRVTFNGIRLLDTTAGSRGIDEIYLQVGANAGQLLGINLELGGLGIPYDMSAVSLPFAVGSILNHTALALRGAAGNNYISLPRPGSLGPQGTSFNYSGDESRTLTDAGTAFIEIPPNGVANGFSQTDWISHMIGNVDGAISVVTTVRGKLGAIQNRLEFTIQNLDISSENLSSANGRIRDADMATEMMRLTNTNPHLKS